VFTDPILRPEVQDPAVFADGVNNIVEAQQRVAAAYFTDGSIEDACPPLFALLHIMAYGQWEGKDANHPAVRALFTPEALLESEWYKERLKVKQQRDIALWRRHGHALSEFLALPSHRDEAVRLGIKSRLDHAKAELARVSSDDYRRQLIGTIGADPIHKQTNATKRLARTIVEGARAIVEARLASR